MQTDSGLLMIQCVMQALAGERACYNSILSFGSQMLVLGTKTVHILSVRTWSERLDHLLRKKQHLDALALGLSIYQDRAKAVVGLKGSHSKKRATVKEKVSNLFNYPFFFINDFLILPISLVVLLRFCQYSIYT